MTNPEEVLSSLPVPACGARYVVAFSGGLDSTVLLHALVAVAGEVPVAAVHVHHGLQAAADDWAGHCRRQCEALGVPLTVAQVRVEGAGEAAARDARYAALREQVRPGDILLTAQHADDQAETLLLQAMRGAGVAGLAAMPAVRAFGPASLARPLLGVPRAALADYARERGLAWVEDPSNHDPAVARSALRQRVMPALAEIRADAVSGLAQTAEAAAEAAALVGEVAGDDACACAGPVEASLDLERLAALSAPRRRNLLRRWPERHGLPAMPPRQVDAVESELMPARPDAAPRVTWPGAELRRYRNGLFLMAPLAPAPVDSPTSWDGAGPLTLPAGCGWLVPVIEEGGGLRCDTGPYTVRFRRGGERLRLPGRAHDTTLKTWLQAIGAPPWVRARLPLIYAGERLAAVADWLVCEEFAAAGTARGRRVRWVAPPPAAALPRVVGGRQLG